MTNNINKGLTAQDIRRMTEDEVRAELKRARWRRAGLYLWIGVAGCTVMLPIFIIVGVIRLFELLQPVWDFINDVLFDPLRRLAGADRLNKRLNDLNHDSYHLEARWEVLTGEKIGRRKKRHKAEMKKAAKREMEDEWE